MLCFDVLADYHERTHTHLFDRIHAHTHTHTHCRHWVARQEAIGIIGKMTSRGDQRAVTAIMGTVNDENAAVRAKSVHVLSLIANVGDMQVRNPLLLLLRSIPHGRIRTATLMF